MKEKKKIIVLLATEEDLLDKNIYKEFINEYVSRNSNLIAVHDIFFLKALRKKTIKKEVLKKRSAYYIFNLIPFKRFRLIYSLNIVLKKFFILFLTTFSHLTKREVVLFIGFNMYNHIRNYLNGFNSQIYLSYPDLKFLTLNKQIETVEMIRTIAIKAKAVFTRTREETREMKIFNKAVIQKSWPKWRNKKLTVDELISLRKNTNHPPKNLIIN